MAVEEKHKLEKEVEGLREEITNYQTQIENQIDFNDS